MVPNLLLSQTHGEPLPNPNKFQGIVRAFQYCTLTRLDIEFATVNRVDQYMHASFEIHWQEARTLTLQWLMKDLGFQSWMCH